MLIPRRQLRLATALLLLIAAVVAWNSMDNNTQKKTALSAAAKSDIDFFIEQATFKSFAIDGSLAQVATADKVEHFKQKQLSHLSSPIISSFKQQIKSAEISSDTAFIQDKKGTVTFNQHVKVTSFKENNANTFLNTSVLHYDRSANTISTDAHVEFSDTLGSITTATGLFSDVNLKTINLKSNVKGKINAK